MMTSVLATTPTPSPAPNPFGLVFSSMGQGFWLAATSSPLAGLMLVLLAAMVVVRVYRAFRWMPLTAAPRDRMRRYAGADRAAVIYRAGARCEHDGLLGGRCNVTEKLQADHIHPYSKGGSTTVGNGQALCSVHNKRKAARIPFNWELRRLEKHRATYSPAGISLTVVRRSSREPLTPGSRSRRR
jgi:hypothetical protein